LRGRHRLDWPTAQFYGLQGTTADGRPASAARLRCVLSAQHHSPRCQARWSRTTPLSSPIQRDVLRSLIMASYFSRLPVTVCPSRLMTIALFVSRCAGSVRCYPHDTGRCAQELSAVILPPMPPALPQTSRHSLLGWPGISSWPASFRSVFVR